MERSALKSIPSVSVANSRTAGGSKSLGMLMWGIERCTVGSPSVVAMGFEFFTKSNNVLWDR